MATLPANSTFLPVLDDLLSPDFRPVSIPGQTPQTPAETPVSATAPKAPGFGENHTGQLTSKTGFTGSKDQQENQIQHNGQGHGGSSGANTAAGLKHHGLHPHHHHHHTHGHGHGSHNHTHGHHQKHQHAASKIQKWWKSRKGKAKTENGTVDIKAERAKHSIRHQRAEEHVRYLEGEVHRLKSALSTERKLRSLQLEAIRSLWTQVQKVSSVSSSPPSGDSSIMSQSMPNGLPIGNKGKDSMTSGVMSMSLHSALDQQKPKQDQNESGGPGCCCTKEIQNLRESLTSEMVQLRQMIDKLSLEGNGKVAAATAEAVSEADGNGSGDESRISQQKRPLTLNLVGISSKDGPQSHPENDDQNGGDSKTGPEKKEIAGYADQMASTIIDAVEKDDVKE